MVTIGICARNCERTIKKAIDSVLEQDYSSEDIEIMLVDDGSEDSTPLIMRKYLHLKNPHIMLFENNWMGLGQSRNLIVDNSNGNYIIWVDGDMVLPKDHIRKQVEFMEQHPEVGIGKAHYGLSPNESIVSFLENVVDVARDSISDSEWKSDLKLPGTGGSIFRVKAIREVRGFDNRLKRVGEDQDAAYRIKKTGWSIYRSNALFYERRNVRNWKALWDKNFKYGYDHYLLYRKNRNLFIPYRMVPPVSFIDGLLTTYVAYRLTRRKVVFLLPFQYAFKMTAWFFGFIVRQKRFNE